MKTAFKLTTSIVALLFVSMTTWSQTNSDCSKFKTGKFEIDNGDGTISTIERTTTYQFEYTDKGKTEIKDSLIWISDCKYKLVPLKSTYKNRKMKKMMEDNILYFEFVEMLDHAYIVKISSPSLQFETEAKVYEAGYLNYDKLE